MPASNRSRPRISTPLTSANRTSSISAGGARIGRLLRAAFACALACCLVAGLGYPASDACAEVRKTDAVLGVSVDSRGLSAEQCPSIDAQYAVVMDSEGTVYFERDAYAPAQIASITKVMTALVALETLPLDAEVTVSAAAATVGESSASLMDGDRMPLSTALEALLLSSGNDAAIAIGETVGRSLLGNDAASGDEAMAAFITRMNERAVELGCTDTVFENPHGLDHDQFAGNQHSCAMDVALMVKAAMAIDTFRTIVATPAATIEVTRADGQTGTIDLQTTDLMLTGGFEGACGVKTGFTALAGQCFAGAANRGGKEFYAIVLNSTSETQRFADAETLLDWAFAHTTSYPLINATGTVSYNGASYPLVAEVAHQDFTDVTVPATVADPNQAIEVFDLSGNVSQDVEFEQITGNVHAGDKVGTLTFLQRNAQVASVDLIAACDVEAPSLFDGIIIWWTRLFSGFTGAQTVAESSLYNATPLIVDKTAS